MSHPKYLTAFLLMISALAGCDRLAEVGRAPTFSDIAGDTEHFALYSTPFPRVSDGYAPSDAASLWSAQRGSLLGDRRASRRGDILTVVIEIDERAEMSNASDHSRSGTTDMELPQLFGLPQSVDKRMTAGSSLANAVDARGGTDFSGDGSVARKEKLRLRVAATVVEELPNGVLKIEGQQEVRVNFELRELIVSGYVRPTDISRQNEITYDKIAGARVAYGGRGQITNVQQPRWGQQITDAILPF